MLHTARILRFSVFSLAFCLTCIGQTTLVTGAKNATRIMPLSQVKEGARGIAKTVFRGSEPEEFNVEILGIVPGAIGPHQDMIIGKLSGANAERTLVFAGMSGSPVYIDGKLVGAVSYSFPFSKEPICGITPIEQMISIFEQAPSSKLANAAPRVYTSTELLATTWRHASGQNLSSPGLIVTGMAAESRLTAVAGQTFRPIATPMTFSGVSQSVLDLFAPDLMQGGILPVAASGGGSMAGPMKPADATTLVGGDSIVVHLARGDVSIAAAGTVTLRDGDKIYAFGHPYFSLGATNLPMSESHVVTVVPNTNNSFKLAVPDATVGKLTQDRATGILGTLGLTAKMLPVKMDLTTSRGRIEQINFESALDDFLTPLIVNVGILNSISANERGIGDTTVELTGEITIAGEKSVKIARRFAGTQAAALAASAPAVPLAALLRSNFDGLDITGVHIAIKVTDGAKTAVLERLTTDRTQAHAGETVELTAYARTDSGKVLVQKIPLKIPAGAAIGAISIMIGDGNALQEKSAVQQFVPKNAAELIDTINHLRRPDRLYVVAFRTSTGAIIGSSEMPNLPPSFLATLNNDRTSGGTKPSVQTVLAEQEISPVDHIISGQQTLAIEIIR